jgi:hypothetical protein
MYVDSRMMAEIVSRNMWECKNKFIVQQLEIKTLFIDAVSICVPVSLFVVANFCHKSIFNLLKRNVYSAGSIV